VKTRRVVVGLSLGWRRRVFTVICAMLLPGVDPEASARKAFATGKFS